MGLGNQLENISDIQEVGLQGLVKLITEADLFSETEQTLSAKCGEHIKDVLDETLMNIQSNMQTNPELAADCVSGVYQLLQGLRQSNINMTVLFEQMGIDSNHPLIVSEQVNSKDKGEFLSTLANNIKDWQLSGKSLKYSIKKLRQSAQGRQLLTRKSKLNITDALLHNFIESFHVSERAEIFTRVEKYIESGWFEQDNPFADFYNGTISEKQALSNLKECMGKRFVHAKVMKVPVGAYEDYHLIINHERSMGEGVFNLAKSGQKDFCIASVDGQTLYLGDITTDETGYANNNAWLVAAKAIEAYKEKHPQMQVNYSVSLMSLFYDANHETKIKDGFLSKLKESSQSIISKWHLIQYLAVLDRDALDVRYDIKKTLANTEVNFFGSESETYCNKVLKLPKDQFISQVLNDFKELLENFDDKQYINAQGMKTNIESTPVHLLIAAIKGFESVVSYSPQHTQQYCQLQPALEKLSNQLVNVGHMKKECKVLVRLMSHPEDILKDYNEELSGYQKQKEQREALIAQNELLNNAMQVRFEEVFKAYKKMVFNLFKNIDPFIRAQSQTWAGNYNQVIVDTKAMLNKIENQWNLPANQKTPAVVYPNMSIEKQNNNLKKLLFKIANTPRFYCENSTPLGLVKEIEDTIKLIDVFAKDPYLLFDMFQTGTIKNTQNKFSLYGRFLVEAEKIDPLNKTFLNTWDLVRNTYVNHVKTQTMDDLADIKLYLQTCQEIKANIDNNSNKIK